MVDLTEFGQRIHVKARTADVFNYHFENRPLIYLRIGLLVGTLIVVLFFMGSSPGGLYSLLFTGFIALLALFTLVVNQDFIILVDVPSRTVSQVVRFWPWPRPTSVLRAKFENITSIDVLTSREDHSEVHRIFARTNLGGQLILGKYIYNKDQANRLRAVLLSYIMDDDSALPVKPFVPSKGSDIFDYTGRKAYGLGFMLLFVALFFTIFMFFMRPMVAFILSASTSSIAFLLCFRGVEQIEQKVSSEMVNPEFFFKIQARKRLAYLMMIIMVIGEFAMAVSIQGSINAGPEAVEALLNSDVDNGFEVVGILAMIACFIGMFGFMFATSDVVDANLKKNRPAPA